MKNLYLILLLSLVGVKISHSQENIKLRTDRDLYVAGESVWLNINCFDYDSVLVKGASRVVYVELLNQFNTPVKQAKVFLKDGASTSKIVIPDSCSTGNFQLRAYTRWMKNFDVSLFESKIITIINPFVRKRFPIGDTFFATDTLIVDAEGGKALKGMANNLLIRSYDSKGNLQKSKGTLLNPQGDSLTTLTISDDGILMHSFVPKMTGQYVFQIEVDTLHVLNLPFVKVEDKGTVLSFVEESSLDVSLCTKSNNSTIEKGELHVLTRQGFLVHKITLANINNAKISISKDEIKVKNRFFNVCLLNENNEVVSSRFIEFRKNIDESIDIKLNKNRFEKRERVEINLATSQNLSNISISVVPQHSFLKRFPFYSGITLSMFEQFKIEELAQKKILVNHLLVGVKQMDKYIFDSKFSELPELEGEVISGKIVDKDSKLPIIGKRFSLSFVSDHPQLFLADTDSNGHFKFIVNEFGEQDMIIQPLDNEMDSLSYSIILDQTFCERYDDSWQYPLAMTKDEFAALNAMVVNMQVNTLYEQYQPFKDVLYDYSNKLNFYGDPLYVTTIDKFIDLPNMEEVFNEIVGVVYVRKSKGKYEMHIVDDKTIPAQKEEVLIMIDGVPVWDLEKVMQIYPLDLKKIEVVNLNYYLKDNNLGYILSIFSNKGDLSVYDFNKELFRQSRMGLTSDYQFATPNYKIDSTGFGRIADFRNTLYWNTVGGMRGKNKGNFAFYTADCSASYKVIIQGINEAGVIRKSEMSFVVE